MMHTYEVNVTREDKWWMITVPELTRYVTADGSINLSDTTQARRLSEVPTQARDFICTVTDQAPSEVEVRVVGGAEMRIGLRRPTRCRRFPWFSLKA